jgi:hypothetical protein
MGNVGGSAGAAWGDGRHGVSRAGAPGEPLRIETRSRGDVRISDTSGKAWCPGGDVNHRAFWVSFRLEVPRGVRLSLRAGNGGIRVSRR